MDYTFINNNFENLDKALSYYTKDEEFMQYINRVPKSRYYTFKYCLEHFDKQNHKTIVELGTTRSFVDGRFVGCNSDNLIYWEPHNPDKWDWSAGCFTKTFADSVKNIPNIDFHTVDISPNHIYRCQIMNEKEYPFINFTVSSSEDFLKTFDKKIDLLYLDTGDMTPIDTTAQLHLREAKIIVERDLITKGGILLIDDVRSVVPYQHGCKQELGKGYLSIPYFLQNGFKLIMDEYQTILQKE